MRWQDLLYFNKMFPMGLRSAAYCCQCVTNAVAHVHHTYNFWSINYLDDFGDTEPYDVAWQSYFCLHYILDSLGIQEALDKACPPSPRMEFLGNIVDAQKMTLEVSPQRVD